MAGTMEPTILVPINIAEAPSLNPGLIELLGPLDVVLLGYYPVPDQAAPEQFRETYESEALTELEGYAEKFSTENGDVEAVLVFTRDREASVDRVAAEYACDAILSPGGFTQVHRLLVPLRGDPNLKRIVSFVSNLLDESDAEVTLYHAISTEEDPTEGEFILRGVADRLHESGIDRDRVSWELSEPDSPADEIVALAADHDVVVIGESEPSLRERILGDVPQRIIDQTGRPVLVIRARE